MSVALLFFLSGHQFAFTVFDEMYHRPFGRADINATTAFQAGENIQLFRFVKKLMLAVYTKNVWLQEHGTGFHALPAPNTSTIVAGDYKLGLLDQNPGSSLDNRDVQ